MRFTPIALRRIALLGAGLLLTPIGQISAQSNTCRSHCERKAAGWAVYATTGAAALKTADMNVRLAAAGYYALSEDAVAFGGGGYGTFGDLKLGAEHIRMDGGEEGNPSGREAKIEAYYTTVTLGYELRPASRVSLTPKLGIGRGSYVVKVGDRNGGSVPTNRDPTFDEILATPGRLSTITGGHWLYEPALSSDILIVRHAGQKLGLILGVHAGYRIAPNRADWHLGGRKVVGGPIDQAKGPIFRLNIGIGGL